MAKKQINQESYAFVSDWHTRSSNKQIRFNIILVVALAAAFLTTAFFYWSKHENHELVVDHNMKYLQICGIQEADRVEDSLNDGLIYIENFAGRYSSMVKLLPDTAVEDKLRLLVDGNLFDRIGYVSADGKDITLEGTADVSDREYFKKGMNGETGYDFLKESRVTNRPCVVFYAPVVIEDNIEGVIIGFYETSRLKNLFSVEVYDYSPNAYLLLGDGSLVVTSNEKSSYDNLLDALADCSFHGDIGYEDIVNAVNHKSRTSIMFEFFENVNEPSVGVITQLQQCDWMILSVLPGSVSSAMIHSTNRIGRILMFGVSSIFIILIIVMVLVISHNARIAKAEMQETRERLKTALDQEQKQSFIVNTLAASYPSVYLIDTVTGKYERIEERQRSSLEALPAKGLWHDTFTLYIEKFVDARYKDMIAFFSDAAHFAERIGSRDSVGAEFMRADGGWRKIFLLPARRDENGKIISVIFAVQRIDEEKQKELKAQKALHEAFNAAQLANEAKTTFLSNMSHDIRTPMNAIIGMTTIASSNLDDRDRVSDCLRKITSSGRHLLGLINEILDMSKIESGRVDLAEDEFSLSGLIDDLVNMNQVLIKEKNHRLTVSTEGLTHVNVIGDRTRLQQVFTNLLTNAIKYTPAGGELSITLAEDTAEGSAVGKYRAWFRDNGIGMSKEFMETMFEPFSRARDDRLIGIQGTGLGMPIARNIIRMMNGDIKVKSELNKGSCFTVSFMLRLQPDNIPAKNGGEAEHDAAEVDFSGTRVLLAEDNELNLEVAIAMLSMLGLEIETARNGREAVDMLVSSEPGHFDLIFMDIQMPVMNGYEAAGAIRASSHQDAQTVPIVAMTANAFSSDVRAAIDAGMNDHVSKPIDIDVVAKVIKKFVRKNQ